LILVTGASGFIGKHLMKALGHRGVGVSRHEAPGRLSVQFDLTAPPNNEFLDAIRRHEVSHIIHAAGITPWAPDPDYSLDLSMAQTITAAANELRIPRVTYISGWNVYAMDGLPPFGENTPLRGAGAYGESKLAVENYLTGNLRNSVLTKLRLASVYGPGQTSPGLIPNLVQSALKTGVMELGSRLTRRDYLYVDGVVEAVLGLAQIPVAQSMSLNLGSGSSSSVMEIAQAIRKVLESAASSSIPIKLADKIAEAPLADNRLDITKARSLGLLKEITPLQTGLREFIKWRQNQP
jgi:nucleoside-diphosphate-sugar epimerase